MRYITWSVHGSLSVSSEGGDWTDEDELLSCLSNGEFRVSSEQLVTCWTDSCLVFSVRTPESEGFKSEGFKSEGFKSEGFKSEGFKSEGFKSEGLVSCLRFLFAELASLFLKVLCTGFG